MFKNVGYTINKKYINRLSLHKKQESSKFFVKTDFEEFDFDFKDMLGWRYYPSYCFATIIDNKIVSCASAGYHAGRKSNIVEISTVAHKDYRGKGYAVSNVVALCWHVLNMQEKREIHYVTDIKNIASQKTAQSAGLIKKHFFYILLRKLRSKLN